MNVETAAFTFALVLLTLLSAYFSSAEVAFFSLSPMQVKSYQEDSDPRKRLIGSLVLKPRDLLVTVFMTNTLINICLQNVASDMFSNFSGWTLKVGVPLALTLIFGEIIPKNLGMEYNTQLAYAFAPGIHWIQNLCAPLRKFFILITTPISRVLFCFLKKAPPISKDELRHTLETSEKYGVLSADEAELAKGYLALQEATVKEVMRQRSEILHYSLSEPLSKLIYLFKDEECTRIPIYEKDINNLHGIISAKQYFLVKDLIHKPKDLLPYLSKPFFVPETIQARALLRKFIEHSETFALVIDEYGSISGLITQEDISELVVGEIKDFRDKKQLFTRAGKDEIIAGGRLEISEFNSLFEAELPNPHHLLTLGGWLIDQFEEIPKSGAKYETDLFFFHVLAADPNRIRRIYVRKKTKSEATIL